MLITNKHQHGFSMIEVLVSLIIIGVGLLGLSGLQIASMRGTNNAHSMNIASMLVMELSDRMRANPLGVSGGFYENDVNCGFGDDEEAQCGDNTFCTPQNIARLDVQEIMCGVKQSSNSREGGAANLLPSSNLMIDHAVDCDPNFINADETSITVTWNSSKIDEDQPDADQNKTMTICTIP